jgi:hypothetical protein
MTELEFKQWIFDPMRLELSPQALLLLLYIKMQNRQRYVFSAESMTRAMRFKDIRTMRRYKAELLDKGLIRQERCQYGLKITIPALDSDSTFYAPSENSDSTFHALSENSDSTKHALSEKADSTYHAPSHESDSTKYVPSENSDSTYNAPSDNNAQSDSANFAPSENSDSTFCADQIVHSVQSDSTFHAPSDSTFCAPLSINKETNKETNKGDTSEKKFAASQQSDFSPSRDFLSQKKKAAKHSDLPEVSEMDEDKQKMISDLMTRFAQ